MTTFQNCRIHTYYLTAKCTFESNIWFPTLSLCLVWYWYILLCSQSRDATQQIALLLMYIGEESTGNIVYFIHAVYPVFIGQFLVAWQQHIWPVRTDWISYICTCVSSDTSARLPLNLTFLFLHTGDYTTSNRSLFQPGMSNCFNTNNSCNWACSPVSVTLWNEWISPNLKSFTIMTDTEVFPEVLQIFCVSQVN